MDSNEVQNKFHAILKRKAELKNKCEMCGDDLGKVLEVRCPMCKFSAELDKEKEKIFDVCFFCKEILTNEDKNMTAAFNAPKKLCWNCCVCGKLESLKITYKVVCVNVDQSEEIIEIKAFNRSDVLDESRRLKPEATAYIVEEIK